MKRYLIPCVLCLSILLSLLSPFPVMGEESAESFKERIIASVLRHEEVIDVGEHALTQENMMALIEELRLSRPEFFLVKEIACELSAEEEDCVEQIKVTYQMDQKESEEAWNFCLNQARPYVIAAADVTVVPSSILKVHELFLQSFTCSDSLEASNAYDFFKEKGGNSLGASMAFKVIGDLIGLETQIITSVQMSHSWNTVRLEGNRFHIDLTSDDLLSPLRGRINRSHCLLSDTALKQLGYTDFPEGSCESDRYDLADWKRVYSPICYAGGYFFYIDEEGSSIDRAQQISVEGTPSLRLEKNWVDAAGTPIEQIYSGLCTHKDVLYFNTSTQIISYNPDTLQSEVYATPALSQGEQIFDLWIADNRLWYSVGTDVSAAQTATTSFELPADEVFTVIFISGGDILQTYKLSYGSVIPSPDVTPTKAATQEGSYHFSRWDGYTTGMKAFENKVFRAIFLFVPRATAAPVVPPSSTRTPLTPSVSTQAPYITQAPSGNTPLLPPYTTTQTPSVSQNSGSNAPWTSQAATTSNGATIPAASSLPDDPVGSAGATQATSTAAASTSALHSTTKPIPGHSDTPGFTHAFPTIPSSSRIPTVTPSQDDSDFNEEQPKDRSEGAYREYLPWLVALSGSFVVVGLIIVRETLILPKKKAKKTSRRSTDRLFPASRVRKRYARS